MQLLYYDEDNTVIDVEDIIIYDLKKNKSQTEKLYVMLFNDDTYEIIDYDRYELNLLGAYIY